MKLHMPQSVVDTAVQLPASKSISNRLLIIQAIAQGGEITNLSDAEDTKILKELLENKPPIVDVGHAGTAFRFLTAFLATQPGEWTLTGSDRMKNRPIEPLVTALQKLGADISYLEKDGFPPLAINGQKLKGGNVKISSDVSSQFISALLLIAPLCEDRLQLTLDGKIVSEPYIDMTIKLMSTCGVEAKKEGNVLSVLPSKYRTKNIEVEYDWSAASFWYEWVAIAKIPHLVLSNVKRESIQGDARVIDLFEPFGVKSEFREDGLHLHFRQQEHIDIPRILDFSETPDLVQPFLATLAAFNYPMVLAGTGNLKFKETDRLQAMKNELAKLGAIIDVAEDSVLLLKGVDSAISSNISIATYEDHRMAMCFAPFVSVATELEIENPEVVRKSYPNYWREIQKIGLKIS